ncbi:MAG: sulfotransferase [Cyanobacteria bacterium K_Offshore_surface_m2_011]|nr:sulfotransferase [Cyanobacteria bacterium K_Offshore_surface_m2_011]
MMPLVSITLKKAPPNLIRIRFFQKLFPNSKFIVILRHPLAVSFATQKWSKTSIGELIDHTLLGYEIFMNDMDYLCNVYVLRYEDFVANPQDEIDKVYYFLNLESLHIQHTVKPDVNEKYFSMWEANRKSCLKRLLLPVDGCLEKRANKFGYSIYNYRNLLPSPILGVHNKALHSDGNSAALHCRR